MCHKISIIIPTYRRPELLALGLDALLAQIPGQQNFEVIVVDNEPSSNQAVLALCSNKKYEPIGLRYLHQSKSGTSQARNLGISVADSPWLGFLDDDAIPSQDWIINAFAAIEASNADIIGGPYYPFFTSSVPIWFREEYGSGMLAAQAGRIEKNKYLFAGNLLVKNVLFKKLGGFSSSFGYIGKKIIFGEETEFQHRAANAGALIWYAPTMIVKHHFPENNFRVRWFFSRGYRQGYAKAQIYFAQWSAEDHRSKLRRIISQVYLYAGLIIKILGKMIAMIFRPRVKYPYWQNYAIECIRPTFVKLGIAAKTLEIYLSKGSLL